MRRWLSIVLVAVGAFGLGGCGDGNGNPFNTGGVGGDPLKCSDFTTPPPGCDSPCPTGSDSECELGTFCFNGVCSAQCTAEQGCGSNFECNSRGRCIPTFTGTGGTSGTGGNACQSVQVTPTRSVPNVMFLVDQSGSMDANDFGPMNLNRWAAAHSAITNIASDPLDDIVRFGLTTYTSRDGNANPPCPRLPVAGNPLAASPRVDFGFNTGGAISNNSIYPSTYPDDAGEDTPTGDSIDTLVGLIQMTPPPDDGPTIIVVATDGEPDSCEFPDPSNDTERDSARQEVVDAAAASHAADIDVFVLWVGELSSMSTRDHLQEVANAGVDGTGTVWVGDDPASLSNAFQSIVSDSISCDIEIDKPFDDKEKACNDPESDVRLNGTPLSCPEDWRVKPGVDNIIELVGSACDTFKGGAATFTAEFPCGAIVVE